MFFPDLGGGLNIVLAPLIGGRVDRGNDWWPGRKIMWVKRCHVYHPPVVTIFIGAINLPFLVMVGEMKLFYPHQSHILLIFP